MSDWKKVRLGNYIHEYSERNKDDADIPVYSVTNSNGFCTEYFSKEVASKDKTTYKIVRKGYFAYNPSRINVGSVDWLRNEDAVIVSPLYNVFYVDDSIDQQYLYYYLKSPVGSYYISELASGSVRDNLKLSILSEFRIPLPDIKTQKEIVATLDSIVHMISVCNAILKKIDLLVKSRFVEMFGNFVYDKDRWSKCLVGDVAGTVDPQPSHRTPPVEANGIPYIGIAECNYQTRTIDFASARKVGNNVLQEHIARYNLHIGDFIIGKIGTIGKPFFVPAERTYALSANTVLIQPDTKRIAPYYLFSIFQSEYMDRIIDAEKKSTSQPAFGIQKVRAIEIPLPPLALQEQFAAFVEQTDKSKLAVKQVLEKAEMLKKALMQEYFG